MKPFSTNNDFRVIITGAIVSIFLIFIAVAIFIEFPRMGNQRDKRDQLIGNYILIGKDTVQVIGYIGGHHTLSLSNGSEIDIDLAYEKMIKK